jgi:hypothetical protein
MEKVLFITNRNALTTCGALRLIKNRAEALFNDYGIATDFIIFQKASRVNSPSREFINAGGDSYVVGYSKSSFFKSLNVLKKTITEKISHSDYKAIFISQVALYIDVKRIRKHSSAPILMDFHGAPNDVYGSVKKTSFISYSFRRLLTIYYFRCLRYYFKNVDGCLVVSSGLEDYFRKKFNPKESFKFFRVPCSLSTELDVSDYMKYRAEYRNQFGANEKDIVFVYSGGIEPWQCVEETIALYKKIECSVTQSTKLCVFSYEIDKARELVSNNENCIFKSYKSDELEKALCACDYAFLLRKDITTNHVAFPNKFLEYIKSYLRVIATPYVYDVSKQIETDNLGVIIDMKDDEKAVEYVQKTLLEKITPETVSAVIQRNSFKETLKRVVSFIRKQD